MEGYENRLRHMAMIGADSGSTTLAILGDSDSTATSSEGNCEYRRPGRGETVVCYRRICIDTGIAVSVESPSPTSVFPLSRWSPSQTTALGEQSQRTRPLRDNLAILDTFVAYKIPRGSLRSVQQPSPSSFSSQWLIPQARSATRVLGTLISCHSLLLPLTLLYPSQVAIQTTSPGRPYLGVRLGTPRSSFTPPLRGKLRFPTATSFINARDTTPRWEIERWNIGMLRSTWMSSSKPTCPSQHESSAG